MAAFGTASYIATGGLDGQVSEIMGETDRFEVSSGTWSKCQSMPTYRWKMAATSSSNAVYVVGGAYTPTADPQGSSLDATEATEMYTVSTDTWTSKSAIPTAREGLCPLTKDGTLYFIGGQVP
jgi:N-acetylneuraminic acid mutarotase